MMSIDEIKEKSAPVLKKWGVSRAVLFGSYASGEAKEESDIDILVELPEDMSLLDFVGLKLDMERAVGKKVDLVEFESIKPSIRKSILKNQVWLT